MRGVPRAQLDTGGRKKVPLGIVPRSQQQLGQWAVRTGFYLLSAAAFVSSLSLLVLRHRAMEAEEEWGRGDSVVVGGTLGGNSTTRRGSDKGGVVGISNPASSAEEELTKEADFKSWVDGLLNVSVPILLSKRALRSKDPFSCGGSHVVKFKFYRDLKSVTHLAEVLPERDLLTTPGKAAERKYDTCAVVGNSGSLLETQYGDMIDNHDVVIRFNAAKTEGYEQFVGYKTTFRLLNSIDMKVTTEPNEAGITTLRNNDIKDWAKQVMQSGSSATSLTTDPEFLCHCWGWVHNRGDKPSSGLVGIVMALKMCRKVDIYGFQYSNYFSRYSRPHYYDWERPKKGREKVHPFTREVALYAQLAKHEYLKVW